MRTVIVFASLVSLVLSQTSSEKQVVCYYDSRSANRSFLANLQLSDMKPALEFCTHLVYGYAIIDPSTYELTPLIAELDVEKEYYATFTSLSKENGELMKLLAVGGDADTDQPDKYMSLLESEGDRTAFVNSVMPLLDQYNFDGISLDWQFPKIDPIEKQPLQQGQGGQQKQGLFQVTGQLTGSVTGGFGFKFGSGKRNTPTLPPVVANKYQTGFTKLVRELREALGDKLFYVTVLPNVKSSVYFDVEAINEVVDMVNLATYDYFTPDRNSKIADYTAPLYQPEDRAPDGRNAHSEVTFWLDSGAEAEKLLMAVPTFARVWKQPTENKELCEPPLMVDGPAKPGPHLNSSGIFSYVDICLYTYKKGVTPFVTEVTSERFGPYAYRLPEPSVDFKGLWISHTNPDYTRTKVDYIKDMNLGGVSVVDLTLDDFRGFCQQGKHTKFPILQAASKRLLD